jgi:uncharacterized membrane protein YczE
MPLFGYTMKSGAMLTRTRIAITVAIVFVLVLCQNLPQDHIPTLLDLYKAIVIAAIVALTQMLQKATDGTLEKTKR